MNIFKTGKSWQDAMIYADAMLDVGRDDDAASWRLLANVQRMVDELWAAYSETWSLTDLCRLPEFRRERVRLTDCGGKTYMVLASFSRKEVSLTLFVEDAIGRALWSISGKGRRFRALHSVAFRRLTVAKHGTDATFRKAALALIG